MSGDTVKTLAAFKKLNALNFTLLSDETGSVAGMFGVPTKPGGTVTQKIGDQIEEFTRGVTIERWTFVIDKAGKVAYNGAIDDKAETEGDPRAAKNYVKDVVGKLQAGEAVTVAKTKPYGCGVKYAN